MKKKIFFIMSTDDFSGAEAVNFSIIEGLKEKYDFYWVSRKGNINNFLDERNIKWIEISSLSVSEIKRVIKDYSPDILHSTDFKASVICALANSKVPLITHLHNNSPWLRKLCPKSIAFLYSSLKADLIYTVSDSIEKEYIFSSLIKNKIVCMGNPISREAVISKVEDSDFEKEYDICCVARLTEQKDPFKFVDVIDRIKAQIPDIKVVWVGKGELESDVIKYISDKKLDDNIVLVGFQKNPYKYMAKSKLFMMTSAWEGFGLVAFEALSLGLPALVSNVGGLPSIVDDSCGLCSNDGQELAVFAAELLKNEEQLKNVSKGAIEKSIKLDNLSDYLKVTDSNYQKFIS